MLGLPSTTEVGRRMPKELFYRNLKLDARTKDEFVQLIDRIEIANSVQAKTANVADGERVHEVDVLRVALKGSEVPRRALGAVAKANAHKLVFVVEPGVEAGGAADEWLWQDGALVEAAHLGDLVIKGATMDQVWDSFRAQMLFGDENGEAIEARIEAARKVNALEREVAQLDARCRRERQIAKRNRLFEQVRARKAALEQARAALARWK